MVRALVLIGCFVATFAAFVACGEFDSNNQTPTENVAADASESDAITGKATSFSISTTNVAVVDGESADVVVKIAREGLLGDTRLELIGLPEGLTSNPITVGVSEKEAKLQIIAAAKLKHGARAGMKVRGTVDNREMMIPIEVLVRGKPGSFDTSFGNGGVADSAFPPSTSAVKAMTIAGDGSITVAATDIPNQTKKTGTVRFNADGSVDTTYGTGGVSALFDIDPKGIASLADGRTVICGQVAGAAGMVGVTKAGDLDSGFALTSTHSSNTAFNACVGDKNAIVAAGSFATINLMGLARVLGDGKPDLTWQEGGSYSRPLANSDSSYLIDVVLRPDGRVLALGVNVSSTGNKLVLLSVPVFGPDETFGTAGLVTLNADAVSGNLTLGSDGSVFVATPKSDMTGTEVRKLTPAGVVNEAFGTAGVGVLTTNDLMRPVGIGIDGSGGVVVGGFDSLGGFSVAAGRLLAATGALDASFGRGKGISVEQIYVNGTAEKFEDSALRVQADGRIVIAGTISYMAGPKIGVVRLWH